MIKLRLLLSCVLVAVCCKVWAQPTTDRQPQPENTKAEKLLKILKTPDDHYVMVAAHRGDWRNEPENSLAAIRNCIDMGVDILETDIQRTKDGHFIILHDATLNRTTTGKGLVKDWTLDSVKTLYLKNGYGAVTQHRVPTLEEALLLVKDKMLIYLDKSPEYIREVYPILQKTNTTRQALFYGDFTAQQLQQRYGDLLGKIMYLPKVDDKTPDIENYIDELEKLADPPVYLVTYETEASPVLPLIKKMKGNNSRIWVAPLWPNMCAGHTDDLAVENPDANWGWVITRGANIICTDRPGLLLQYLRSKGLHD